MPQKQIAIIIGAGPAGLTLACELLKKTNITPIILEASNEIGGISRTINYKGNYIDIGGHRFFSKSKRVIEWWLELLPLGRVDQNTKDVMLLRERKSRIYCFEKFFDYPIAIKFKTLLGLGAKRTCKILISYLFFQWRPIKPEKNLEDFFKNRFGSTLYLTFFKDYTEKVWGIPCSQISSEWGAQRVKGLSISKALLHAIEKIFLRNKIKAKETSLTEEFFYPKFGPGQLWEKAAEKITSNGGKIYFGQKVVRLQENEGEVKAVETEAGNMWHADYFFSTMPLKDLTKGFGSSLPLEVRRVAEGLIYRDFIIVGLLINKTKENVKDNWIYIQEQKIKMGRLQVFNNWSPFLVKDKSTTWIGLEYFCDEGDDFWSKDDKSIIDFAGKELESIGFANQNELLDACVYRIPKAYPAYWGTYGEMDVLKNFVNQFKNLYVLGRNGMHRYNNQDHSMLTAMIAVENIVNGITDKENIWQVNTEQEFHEGT